MNSFWNQLYDRHKDRRYANLFFVTLLCFVGLIVPILAIILHAGTFELHPLYLLPGIVGILIAVIWGTIRHFRRQRHTPAFPRLSRDELRKARSKLKNSFKRFRAKAPDTDLKY